MNWLKKHKLFWKYILPFFIFVTFLACGIWIWSSYVSPWEYTYSNSQYSVSYIFYDKTYAWEQKWNTGTVWEGSGTFETYSDANGKYIHLRGDIPNASGVSDKIFTRKSAHSLTTATESLGNNWISGTFICRSSLTFEIFCGLAITILGPYLLIQVYINYKNKSKKSPTDTQSNDM